MSSIFERPSAPQRRVVVTGIGCLTPLGLNTKETWSKLLEGQSGVGHISQFDASSIGVNIAGEVKGFDVNNYIEKKEQKKMERFIHLSMASTEEAIQDSEIDFSNEELASRTGVIIGVGIGGLSGIEETHKILLDRGPSRISPFFIPRVITNLASGQVSIRYGLKGPNYTVTSACASGNHSIGDAALLIRNGFADVMIAGGSESTICPLAVAGFNAMKALSTRNESPSQASRPWDQDRDGFILAEGSATFVLEDYEHAQKRGAKIYAEVSGYGMSADAYHMTSPSEGGSGAAQAMMLCLKDAGLTPESIAYINAHGTSTPVGDQIEVEALKKVFKDHAKKLAVSSTKSMTGHALGAAGAIESLFTVLTVHKGQIPPTINLDNPSEGCDLDFVPNSGRDLKVDHALNNSFGFGGTNACLIFSRI